jgi:hypothetical protein
MRPTCATSNLLLAPAPTRAVAPARLPMHAARFASNVPAAACLRLVIVFPLARSSRGSARQAALHRWPATRLDLTQSPSATNSSSGERTHDGAPYLAGNRATACSCGIFGSMGEPHLASVRDHPPRARRPQEPGSRMIASRRLAGSVPDASAIDARALALPKQSDRSHRACGGRGGGRRAAGAIPPARSSPTGESLGARQARAWHELDVASSNSRSVE